MSLGFSVDIGGTKELVSRLDRLIGPEVGKAVDRGLKKGAINIYRGAFRNLSGSSKTAPGSYPVPIRTGNLRRLLNFVPPGKAKTSDGVTVKATKHEALIYNVASYAKSIHDGVGASATHGKRAFLMDAYTKADKAKGVRKLVEKEVRVEVRKFYRGQGRGKRSLIV